MTMEKKEAGRNNLSTLWKDGFAYQKNEVLSCSDCYLSDVVIIKKQWITSTKKSW